MIPLCSSRSITASLPITTIVLVTILTFSSMPTPASSQYNACKTSCGGIPVHYPFGTGPGCGSPQFQPYVTCDPQQGLTFTTHSGTYPIQSVDYANQILYIRDPSMSSCACTSPSSGFGLDWDAPFTFLDGSVFALLGCSPAITSPDYYTNSSGGNGPLCDTSSSVCSLLYSCPAVGQQLAAPAPTCCVYAPVSLGPSFDIDLKKLQCGGYAGIYSFGGQESDPRQWKFGIAVKYKFSVDNVFPRACANCEKSNGACGYTAGELGAFTCNCPNGLNTSSDCFFMASYHSGVEERSSTTPRLGLAMGKYL
ncbi:hypothetical protein Taro_035808 [Colocasia esculenta]|uniref:Wall-associated receptor kinase galacturonan-binding domain-containing protein n=1 Tax=Colocasia esculenta TaxID=4460 RepID=A0A843WFX3_COLES|nr:hypothetical protein [Colocasia esculenta]